MMKKKRSNGHVFTSDNYMSGTDDFNTGCKFTFLSFKRKFNCVRSTESFPNIAARNLLMSENVNNHTAHFHKRSAFDVNVSNMFTLDGFFPCVAGRPNQKERISQQAYLNCLWQTFWNKILRAAQHEDGIVNSETELQTFFTRKPMACQPAHKWGHYFP